jgi:hypothetical protein
MNNTTPGAPGPDYYKDQANRYFDTLDFKLWLDPSPNYASDVIRWEHPPWLKLTGYGKAFMTTFDKLQTLYPTYVTKRVCTAYDVAPQTRCSVSFKYIGLASSTPIYEEFTFNDAGEITFIEAWSDSDKIAAEAKEGTLNRLSTKSAKGETSDPDVADLKQRMKHPLYYWVKEAMRFTGELF